MTPEDIQCRWAENPRVEERKGKSLSILKVELWQERERLLTPAKEKCAHRVRQARAKCERIEAQAKAEYDCAFDQAYEEFKIEAAPVEAEYERKLAELEAEMR